MSDSTLSRVFPASCLIAFPVLFLAGDLLFGAEPPDPAAALAGLAADPGPPQLRYLGHLLGTVLAVWGLVGVVHLLRGPGGVVGRLGAGLMMLGALTVTAFSGVFPLLVTAATTPGLDRDQMVALFDAVEAGGGPVPVVLFAGFLVGIVGGQVLLAVGLWLRRAVPPWAPGALLLSAVLTVVASGEQQYLVLIGDALLLIGFAAVGFRMFTLTDEQWARPAPRPQRTAAGAV